MKQIAGTTTKVMNLSDMLVYADIQQLNRIAESYGCECSSNSKHELIQSILSAAGSKDIMETLLQKMPLDELRFMNMLLFEQGKSYSLEDLTARAAQSQFDAEKRKQVEPVKAQPVKQTKTVQKRRKKLETSESSKEEMRTPRDVIVKFKQLGLLFNGNNAETKYLFQVPQDIRGRYRRLLAKRFAFELVHTNDPEMYRDEQDLLLQDMNLLLCFAGQHEIGLSADGSMYKRQLQQVLETLHISEDLPIKGEWRFGYGRHFGIYPNRFSLLYDYCHASGYLQETSDGVLLLTAAGKTKSSQINRQEITKVFVFWLKQYRKAIPNIISIAGWLSILCTEWTTVASLEKVLLPYIKPFYYDDAASVLSQRILAMMLHMGLLRIGEHTSHGAVVKITPVGKMVIEGEFT